MEANEIDIFRKDTPGTEERIHLNNAGAALMPQVVIDKIKEIIDQEAITGGYETMMDRQEEVSEAYEAIGRLLGTDGSHIAFSKSATDAYSVALSSVPFRSGDVVLTTVNDYVSNQITFMAMAKRFNLNIIRVPDQQAGGVDVNAMDEYIRKYSPRLVAVTHVPTNSGLVQDVAAIGKLCRKEDILYLVDGCQSVGQLPLNMEEIGCDFFSATSRKFLRGPRGFGFLYVADQVFDKGLEPMFMDLNGAEWVGPDTYIPGKTGKRFETWEFSYALMLGMSEAAKYALNIGLEKIESRVKMLADYTRQELNTIPGAQVLDKGAELCGIVTVYFEGFDPAKIQHDLIRHQVNVSYALRRNAVIDFDHKGVEWGLRLSPHYYNTKEEIDQAINYLKDIIL